MNDARTQEVHQQHLIDALDREEGLKLELEAAQKEIEQLKRLAIGHESQLQEFNEALEAEETKTNDERTARQNAEATACHHRAEALEAKRKERIANEHCDAAELEVFRLQREMTTERCTIVTANRLLGQLREDLGLAEANRRSGDEQLHAAKAKVHTLNHDLATSNDRVRILEYQVKELGETILKQHQRVEYAENALRTMASELENSNMKLCDSNERYKDLEAAHKQGTLSTAAAAAESVRAHADKPSLHSPHKRDDPGIRERCASSTGFRQVFCDDESTGERMIDKLTSRTVENQVFWNDESTEERTISKLTSRTVEPQPNIAPGTPLFPSPAKHRPLPASVIIYHVESPKTSGTILNRRWLIEKDPPWRLWYWLRPDALRFLYRTYLSGGRL